MVETLCLPGKFAALCRKLTNDQRGLVEKLGLGSLLSIPSMSMPMQRMLVETLVENFNDEDRTFRIQGHVVSISPWDVYCILGLVNKGEKIEVGRKQADRKWFNLYKQLGDTSITFKYLEERIPREADADHFSRMFVLYAIGTILAPSSKGYVGSNYLELVVDVSRIRGLNWARFTLDHLLENLTSFKTSKRSGIAGNLALFQVWFFEHFQASGDGLDYTWHQHPLISNWDEAKVIKRARLQAIKKFGAEKVIIELEPNESKVQIGNQYNEGVRHEDFEKMDCNENVKQEEVNRDDPRDATKDDEIQIKESLESMKSLLERFPELHTIVQMLGKLAAGSNMSTNSDGKHCDSSGTRKPQESQFNYHKESESESPAYKREKLEASGTAATEREVLSPNLSSRVKRKIDYVSSPTLAQKVKTRTNRQPSKVCKSPYTRTNQKRASKTKKNGASVDDVTKGLKLSDLELHPITYVLEELDINPRKDLVRIDASELSASELKCLVTGVREDTLEKWLCSGIIDSYATMLNSEWNKETVERKHAISDGQCQWLRSIGHSWIKTGIPRWSLSHHVAKKFVGADMVFIPVNMTNSHCWLCVLYPGRNEFQVLDSFNRPIDYAKETYELVW